MLRWGNVLYEYSSRTALDMDHRAVQHNILTCRDEGGGVESWTSPNNDHATPAPCIRPPDDICGVEDVGVHAEGRGTPDTSGHLPIY